MLSADSPSVRDLKQRLGESLKLRVLNIPTPPGIDDQQVQTKVAILFSGGLDCTVLARLCHDLLPSGQGVDLINVAFENPRVAANAKKSRNQEAYESFDIYEACPDRITGRRSFAELQAVCPGRVWRFIAVCNQAHDLPFMSHTITRSMSHTLNISNTRARSLHLFTPTTPKWTYPSPVHCILPREDRAQLPLTPPQPLLHLTPYQCECCYQDLVPMNFSEATFVTQQLSRDKATRV